MFNAYVCFETFTNNTILTLFLFSELDVIWTLDTAVKSSPRALFLGGNDKSNTETGTVRLNKRMAGCRTSMVYVKVSYFSTITLAYGYYMS